MIDVKKEIIAKHENGVRVSDHATQFGMAKSTISTILCRCCKRSDSYY